MLRAVDTEPVGNTLRSPPHNYEAERALLGAILMNNRASDRVSGYLRDDHFADPVNGRVYRACKALLDRGSPANPVTLKTFLENDDLIKAAGGMAYIATLAASSVTVINAVEYGKLIYDLFLRRELIALGEDMINEAYEPQPEESAAGQIEDQLGRLSDLLMGGSAIDGLTTIGQAISAVLKQHEMVDKGEITGLPTGIQELDRTQGLLEAGDLFIWAGRPSMGKSALMGTAAVNIAENLLAEAAHTGKRPRNVLVFSQEMTSDDNANRVIAAKTGIQAPRRRTGGALPAEQWGRLVDLETTLASLPITIDARPRATLSRIRAVARRLQHKGGVAAVFVDYLQILGTERGKRTENRTQEVGYFATGLKDIAKELGCPVVALSQLNRGVEQREDKRPNLSDLRESGEIEQAADTVAFCYRDEYYLERGEPKRRADETDDKFHDRYATWQQALTEAHGKAEVIVAKARHGTCGTAKLDFDAARTWFSDRAGTPHTPRAGHTAASFSAMPDGRPQPPVEGI